MSINRILLFFTALLEFLFTPSADAAINTEDVVLGGLVPRTNVSAAFDIYGEPDRIEGQRYYWGTDLR
ncbi:MAG: hypothetical protein IJR38_05270 [Selenomonadaceae bacterium]|nr:hypothetical protein [Selenomonadaceae bacterium]